MKTLKEIRPDPFPRTPCLELARITCEAAQGGGKGGTLILATRGDSGHAAFAHGLSPEQVEAGPIRILHPEVGGVEYANLAELEKALNARSIRLVEIGPADDFHIKVIEGIRELVGRRGF